MGLWEDKLEKECREMIKLGKHRPTYILSPKEMFFLFGKKIENEGETKEKIDCWVNKDCGFINDEFKK